MLNVELFFIFLKHSWLIKFTINVYLVNKLYEYHKLKIKQSTSTSGCCHTQKNHGHQDL